MSTGKAIPTRDFIPEAPEGKAESIPWGCERGLNWFRIAEVGGEEVLAEGDWSQVCRAWRELQLSPESHCIDRRYRAQRGRSVVVEWWVEVAAYPPSLSC